MQSKKSHKLINPFYPNVSMYILPTALLTFHNVLTRGVYKTIKSFFKLVIISFILLALMCNLGVIL